MDKNKEIAFIDATLKLLRKGKFEITGEEAIVLNGCFSYLVGRMNELKQPDIKPVEPKNQIKKKKD